MIILKGSHWWKLFTYRFRRQLRLLFITVKEKSFSSIFSPRRTSIKLRIVDEFDANWKSNAAVVGKEHIFLEQWRRNSRNVRLFLVSDRRQTRHDRREAVAIHFEILDLIRFFDSISSLFAARFLLFLPPTETVFHPSSHHSDLGTAQFYSSDDRFSICHDVLWARRSAVRLKQFLSLVETGGTIPRPAHRSSSWHGLVSNAIFWSFTIDCFPHHDDGSSFTSCRW